MIAYLLAEESEGVYRRVAIQARRIIGPVVIHRPALGTGTYGWSLSHWGTGLHLADRNTLKEARRLARTLEALTDLHVMRPGDLPKTRVRRLTRDIRRIVKETV